VQRLRAQEILLTSLHIHFSTLWPVFNWLKAVESDAKDPMIAKPQHGEDFDDSYKSLFEAFKPANNENGVQKLYARANEIYLFLSEKDFSQIDA
jgi:hypothetical protein